MSRLRSILPRRREPHVPRPYASTLPAGTFNWVRDTGLDHAVQREKNLIPLITTKNLLVAEPSKSLPLSSIADLRDSLSIPHRPSDFLRRYPSVFREPPNVPDPDPTFSLTAEALQLHSDESLMFSGDNYRNDIAERLLKLVMLRRAGKLPLTLLRLFKWDLGLPEDFETSLVPHFPDYFRIVGSGDSQCLELVCWIEEFAVSAMEKSGGDSPGAFPVKYSTGFEMDDEFAKWVEDWQKLPYFSPYDDHSDKLAPNGDESDRWAVAVLHELLSILAPKKTAKENVMWLGECVGMRSRFRRALIRHPGIFYVSSKNYTHTLVLKEAFKRGALVESHAMVEMRSRYIHLMNASWAEKGDSDENDKPRKARPRRDEEEEVDGADELVESSSDEDEEPATRRAGKKERWDRLKPEEGIADDEERTRTRKKGSRAGRGKRGGPKKSGDRAEGVLRTEKKDPTFKEISKRRKDNRGSPTAAAGLSS